jgi:arylsulfatase A-like enzyme
MAEMDYRVGQIVDCVEQAGISSNTLIVFCSDNAALDQGMGHAFGGSNGPWRGTFYTRPGRAATGPAAFSAGPARPRPVW